jgi:hypothetical protein
MHALFISAAIVRALESRTESSGGWPGMIAPPQSDSCHRAQEVVEDDDVPVSGRADGSPPKLISTQARSRMSLVHTKPEVCRSGGRSPELTGSFDVRN